MSSATTPLLRTKNYLLIAGAVFAALWGALFAYQQFLKNQVRRETAITSVNGIDDLQKISLGGISQWLLIRGQDTSRPVLLFLHGGPGSPLFTYARDIGIATGLEEHFVMVYWEQRTIAQFVADTHELSNYLRDRFNAPKIFHRRQI